MPTLRRAMRHSTRTIQFATATRIALGLAPIVSSAIIVPGRTALGHGVPATPGAREARDHRLGHGRFGAAVPPPIERL